MTGASSKAAAGALGSVALSPAGASMSMSMSMSVSGIDTPITLTPGSGTLTLTTTEPAIRITGSLTVTEEPDTLTAAGHIGDTREPPLLAEFLLGAFARTKDIDALLGDEEERFARNCASGMSDRRAAARYWARVLRSVWPQMWRAIKRAGWAGLIAAVLRR